MKNCTPLWPEAHFQDKMCKTHQRRTTFGSCDVEKVHAVVARSTVSDHFWKLRCQKSARRCGAKHISKSKCLKTPRVRTTFGGSDVEKVHAVVREAHFEVKMLKTPGVRFASRRFTTLHYITLHYTKLHYTTLHYTTLHSTTLDYITLHYITLNDTAPQIDR